MYFTFVDITNILKTLGKVYPNEEMVKKWPTILSWDQWGAKVIAIKDAQNLNTFKIYVGNF